jgi:Skp family chaperone for outer membrane proteins
MKKIIFILTILLTLNIETIMAADKKDKATDAQRVAYVLRNIGVKRDIQSKLKPLQESYLREFNAAEAPYEKLKDKLKPQIKMGNISEAQGQQLLNEKWATDERELAVKKSYEKKFKTVLPTKKVYECYRLLNDKSSKILDY